MNAGWSRLQIIRRIRWLLDPDVDVVADDGSIEVKRCEDVEQSDGLRLVLRVSAARAMSRQGTVVIGQEADLPDEVLGNEGLGADVRLLQLCHDRTKDCVVDANRSPHRWNFRWSGDAGLSLAVAFLEQLAQRVRAVARPTLLKLSPCLVSPRLCSLDGGLHLGGEVTVRGRGHVNDRTPTDR